MRALPTIALARQVGALPPNVRVWVLRATLDALGFVHVHATAPRRAIGGAA